MCPVFRLARGPSSAAPGVHQLRVKGSFYKALSTLCLQMGSRAHKDELFGVRSEVFKKSFHMEGVWGHKPGVNNVLYGPPAGRWFPNYCPLALSQRNPNGPTRVRLSILRLLWTPLRESCVLRAGRAAGVVPPCLSSHHDLWLSPLVPTNTPVPKQLGLKRG